MLHLRSKLYSKRSKFEAGLQAFERESAEAVTFKREYMETGRKAVAIKVSIIMGLTLLIGACKKEQYLAPEDQPVYFEYHFTNFAWGVQDFGWLIDRDGKIWSFEFPDGYHTAIHGDYLSLEQLEDNLGQADSLIGDVDVKELDKKVKWIQGASGGELTKIHRRGADAGLGVYACYKYDPSVEAYQFILLSADGDYQQYNRSPDAEKLTDWLKELVD